MIPNTENPEPIRLAGSLRIGDLDAWRSAIESHMAATPNLEIDLSGVADADTFGIQLLLSAERTAAAAGGSLRLRHIPAAVARAAAAVGLDIESFAKPSLTA